MTVARSSGIPFPLHQGMRNKESDSKHRAGKEFLCVFKQASADFANAD
jgi:hypothetical protein